MMSNYAETLPVELRGAYPGLVQNVHEAYQREPLEDFQRRMEHPAVRLLHPDSAPFDIVFPRNWEASRGSERAGHMMITPFPLGIGVNGQMFMRSEMAANSVEHGMSNLVFKNRTLGDGHNHLTRAERRQVARGDYIPITERELRVVENLGATTVHIVGYSQGAPVGVSLAERIHQKGVADVRTLIVAEAPNSAERSYARLGLDFAIAGMKIDKAIEDTQIPNLAKVADGLPGLAKYAAGLPLSPNPAFIRSFRRDTIDAQLESFMDISPSTDLWYVRMGETTILRRESYDETVSKFSGRRNFHPLEVSGYGHEGGDQIVLTSLLARMAIDKFGLPQTQTPSGAADSL